ncbi:MAG: FimV/HubP family polar landmark protein, partial [Pseudomonadota bacterium]|nr:FimV/HubP family polar landmark protein [Pseudomonadota bacterium]
MGLAGAMSAEMASALGLGEIKLNSNLNEPLDAEIKLLQTRDLDEGEILVALAGKEDFQNAGVDRTFFLNDLKFKVHLKGTSGSVIRVTSSKPVREPYLNFLLQTQWPNGRILREYTLLMDLPVFSQETAKPVIRTQATTPKPVAQPQKKQPEPRQTIAKPQAPAKQSQASTKPQSSSAASTYGPVQSSDTLWEIALKVRPDRSVSVHKTMLAIQRLNPEAFINGNINLLRKGQVLRVPDSQEINELSRQEAVSQVAVQNRAWNDTRSSASGPQLDASTRFDADRPKASKVEGRLTLAAAEKVDTARTGQMGGSGTDADTESLQNELAISLEELDKSKRENAELNDRIRELEDQIGTMERLIEVSNQELRALQLANKVRSGEMTESEAQEAAAEEAAAVEEAQQAA